MDSKRDENRAKFLDFLGIIGGPYRYSPTKFRHLLREDWPIIKRIVRGEDDSLRAPSFVEIHPSEPCNLSCQFCRGQLREVPRVQKFLEDELLEKTIWDVYQLNSNAFIRFSGIIGEPLLHRSIVDAFKLANSLEGLSWGLSTNGLLLHGENILGALMGASYVHVSMDAGTDDTYRKLKNGKIGDWERVYSNLDRLVQERDKHESSMQVIVSFLLQAENFRELPILNERLKSIQVDELEIKMQHYDNRRTMSKSDVREAYRTIAQLPKPDDSENYRVFVVQSEEEALRKLSGTTQKIGFSRCYAGKLGLCGTVDPAGGLQSCCQYYQGTLGQQGTTETGLDRIWYGEDRRRILERDPRNCCTNCSPSDEFVNVFVEFMCQAARDDSDFLDWAERKMMGS